ncbi:Uncharacterized protein SCF082_LOCUS21221, partial [Durusdinium trenchii]
MWRSENGQIPLPKLDVEIANLEYRLRAEVRDEISQCIQPLLARLSWVEAQIGAMSHEPRDDDSLLEESQKEYARVSRIPSRSSKDMVSDYQQQQFETTTFQEVKFEASTWNLLLVLGLTDAGMLSDVLAFMVLLVNILMQALFCQTILSPQFAGTSFSIQADAARKWRQLVGHDASYMNPAAHSLVSRVCNNDRTLIMADAQASLIENINAYLGIENLQMHGSCFSPGVLLCTLCIMQWCLYLFEEFRMIVSTSFAIWQVPRAASSLRSNQITGISFTRLVAHGLLTLLRTCIAVVLLNAGILWLAGTTSIEDLMVNGVALVTIINVDEKLFAALMPRRIQRKVEELYAVTPRSSKRGSQAESLVLLGSITCILIWSFATLLAPLKEAMQLVKKEYCAGDIDFVMKVNPSVGVPVALDTAPYLKDENRSFSEVATRDFLGSRAEKRDPLFAISTIKNSDFVSWSGRSWTQWSSGFLDHCGEWNKQEFMNSAAWAVGRGVGHSCEELVMHCLDADAALLRLICPTACRCRDPLLSWYRLPQAGCSQSCIDIGHKESADIPCKDISPTRQEWIDTWRTWPSVGLYAFGMDPSSKEGGVRLAQVQAQARKMLTGGCSALRHEKADPYVNATFCEGFEGLFASLRPLCPETCGCLDAKFELSHDCPLSCKEDIVRARVAFLGCPSF